MQHRYISTLGLKTFTQAAREVPYQRIESDLFPGIEVWIRRDDLLDPIISGNKAYKLLYNLIEAREQGAHTLVTCGGAWSNHIHATAAAGARFGFRTMGIIRGERPPVLSATLQDTERFGMQFRFVSRAQYRERDQADFLDLLGIDQANTHYIPEGGANLAGARGLQLLGKVIEETSPINFDQLWTACGTGLTLAGLLSSAASFSVFGVEVLKAGDSIHRDAQHWLQALSSLSPAVNLIGNHHCGGYAKYPKYLKNFQQSFERQTNIPLDPVYTAKLAYGLRSELLLEKVAPGSKILLLHSGGLQGRRGLTG